MEKRFLIQGILERLNEDEFDTSRRTELLNELSMCGMNVKQKADFLKVETNNIQEFYHALSNYGYLLSDTRLEIKPDKFAPSNE